MAVIYLPAVERTPTGLEQFSNSFSPYLQQAFQAQLQRKMYEFQLQKQQEIANQQRQQNIEQAQEMFPGVFTEIPQKYANIAGMGQVPVKPSEPYTPKYKYNMEKASKYPGLGIDLTTGGMDYKVPQHFFLLVFALLLLTQL